MPGLLPGVWTNSLEKNEYHSNTFLVAFRNGAVWCADGNYQQKSG